MIARLERVPPQHLEDLPHMLRVPRDDLLGSLLRRKPAPRRKWNRLSRIWSNVVETHLTQLGPSPVRLLRRGSVSLATVQVDDGDDARVPHRWGGEAHYNALRAA
jgi:hypothetical protein